MSTFLHQDLRIIFNMILIVVFYHKFFFLLSLLFLEKQNRNLMYLSQYSPHLGRATEDILDSHCHLKQTFI